MEVDIFGAFVAGLATLFTWPTFGLLLVGVAVGFVIGLLPGLGGLAALTIMIPLTFSMEPTAAFALLLSTTAVAATTGDLTAILFGVPGEATAAALVVDGYAMAKKGEAGRALSANLIASLIGAAIGAFAIVLAIPIVRPLVLSFQSPEFFMLTILGLTFIAALSTGAVMKGLIAALAGLQLAMVGLDPQTGVQRFTFDQLYLWDGIGLVPAALGLFAIPELYQLAVRGTSIADRPPSRLTGIGQGLVDAWVHRWLVIRCSLIGTFIGIIPGLGASISQWVAYAHAVQSSADKERFGKGAVEGSLGPGAANNSGLGGSLIPLIAFGVPGSATSAVLLGALLIHGIVPGPPMLTSNLTLTMSFVWVIVVANVIAVLVSFMILNQIAKATFVSGALIVPIVTVFVYVGAFTSNNAFLDLVMTLGFGLIGLMMVSLGWPRPPLLLGLVLGGLVEQNLFISLSRYGLGFILHPVVVILVGLCLVAIFQPAIRRALGARGKSLSLVRTVVVRDRITSRRTTPVRSRLTGDVLFTGLILTIAIGALVAALQWQDRARMMPLAIAVPLVILSASYAVLQVAGQIPASRGQMDLAFTDLDPVTYRQRSAVIVSYLACTAAAIWLVGFLYAGPIAALVYARIVGRERWVPSLGVAAGVAAILLVLTRMLHLPLHEGIVIQSFSLR